MPSIGGATMSAGLGVVAAMTASLYVPHVGGTRWWLDSRAGVGIMLVTLGLVAFLLSLLLSWPLWRDGRWLHPILLWAGANTALTAFMLVTGPGSLFPIALGIGAVLTLFAVGCGSLAGTGIRGVGQSMRRLSAR
jgi:hypothetical protein